MKMQLQIDICKGVPREMAIINFKRNMKLFLKDMAGLKMGLPQPKGETPAWEPNEI